MNPFIGYCLTYGVVSMEFFTNLLRKLRRPKSRAYRYEPRLSKMKQEAKDNPWAYGAEKKDDRRDDIGRPDYMAKHWHHRYYDRRKK